MRELQDKVAVITGGAGGIGRAVGLRLARRGVRVALWDLDAKRLKHAQEEFASRDLAVRTYKVDVTDCAAVQRAAAKVRADLGEVDILNNNAGIVFSGDFLAATEEQLSKTVDVNLKSYLWCTRAFLPGMLERGSGHLIFIASAAGLLGVPGMAVYSATKHAVVGFAESLRLELRKAGATNVRTTIVCPSFIASGMFKGVKPPLFTNWLSPDAIADKIVAAVGKDQLYVREPLLIKFVPLLKALGAGITDWAGDLTGMHSSMEEFKKQ
ncbi:MAG: SDR family oxidoreductase [Elusimicrobiota bacterium]